MEGLEVAWTEVVWRISTVGGHAGDLSFICLAVIHGVLVML